MACKRGTFEAYRILHSFITRLSIRRSGALQQTFYGSPPACSVLGTGSFSMIAYLVAGAARRVLILEDPPEHDISKVVHQRASSPVSLLALHFLQETLEAIAAAAAQWHIDKCKDKLALLHE